MIEVLNVLVELCARRDWPTPRVPGREALLVAFASAGRRVGKSALVLAPAERAQLAAVGIDWPLAARADDLWRLALLAGQAGEPGFAALVGECYRTGDNEERRAVLRALPLLPAPEGFVALAVDSCRTNVVPIFEAIAAENPYPARHFDERAFNQLVMKAVLLELRLARVVGLAARVAPELARMAQDYASQQRAAGRVVPEDLALLAAPAAPAVGKEVV